MCVVGVCVDREKREGEWREREREERDRERSERERGQAVIFHLFCCPD